MSNPTLQQLFRRLWHHITTRWRVQFGLLISTTISELVLRIIPNPIDDLRAKIRSGK